MLPVPWSFLPFELTDGGSRAGAPPGYFFAFLDL